MPPIRLTIPETAEVAEISASQLRRWIKNSEAQRETGVARGRIIAHQDKLSSGQGDDALLSQHTAMQVFVAARLVEAGTSVFDALDAGRKFAHVGDEMRRPSQAFAHGKTWLMVSGGDTRIVNTDNTLVGNSREYARYATLEEAVEAFSARTRASARPSAVAAAVNVLNLSIAPLILEQRIKHVLHEKRPRNTRLSSDGPCDA